MNEVLLLEEKLNVSFRDKALLEQALVHSSFLNENPQATAASNERMEFLGDALIGLVVARELYLGYPDLAEGQMTRLRASIINGEVLAGRAKALGVGDCLILGKGEELDGGRDKERNLAGAFEAVMGALLVDQGLEVASEAVVRLLDEEIKNAVEGRTGVDHKSELQELVQKVYRMTPSYRVAAADGPEHQRRFTAELFVGEDLLGTGTGPSKHKAEREAARAALEKLKGEGVGSRE
ncbi:MAG: ribonuclease III [Chloroflexi bacterium]|nr:ribonuclease III [Chloroflexota bacterium]